MDYKQALEYIDGAKWFGAKPGLERMQELCSRLGDPQDELRFVHIAGTNGKGSCAAMTASVLHAAGYRTGLFTSPYLYRFNERMQINGHQIENDALAEVVTAVAEQAERMDVHPTEFELMTAAAFLWFKKEECDIVVLEVGLGGRFDATNIISVPECAVIMNIGLDHTAVLGNSVAEIAAEKAGIIKNGGDVVLYAQSREAEDVIKLRCAELGARLHITENDKIIEEFDSLEGQVFSYKGRPVAIPLLGEHQQKNAAAVLEAIEVLREKGWKIEDSDIEHGLYAVSWPGRFELAGVEPDFIIDGGHNPQCAEAIIAGLKKYYPGRKYVMILGMMRDKDVRGTAEIFVRAADEFVTLAPESPRALPADELKELLEGLGKSAAACENAAEAIELAREKAGTDGVICAAGSIYLTGQIRYELGLY